MCNLLSNNYNINELWQFSVGKIWCIVEIQHVCHRFYCSYLSCNHWWLGVSRLHCCPEWLTISHKQGGHWSFHRFGLYCFGLPKEYIECMSFIIYNVIAILIYDCIHDDEIVYIVFALQWSYLLSMGLVWATSFIVYETVNGSSTCNDICHSQCPLCNYQLLHDILSLLVHLSWCLTM